jgi:hypothetical protein
MVYKEVWTSLTLPLLSHLRHALPRRYCSSSKTYSRGSSKRGHYLSGHLYCLQSDKLKECSNDRQRAPSQVKFEGIKSASQIRHLQTPIATAPTPENLNINLRCHSFCQTRLQAIGESYRETYQLRFALGSHPSRLAKAFSLMPTLGTSLTRLLLTPTSSRRIEAVC